MYDPCLVNRKFMYLQTKSIDLSCQPVQPAKAHGHELKLFAISEFKDALGL